MTREEFYDMDFYDLLNYLSDEGYDDYIHSRDTMIDAIRHYCDEDNMLMVEHIAHALYEDDADYWRYDFTMGNFEDPTPLNDVSDLEDIFEEYDLLDESIRRTESIRRRRNRRSRRK